MASCQGPAAYRLVSENDKNDKLGIARACRLLKEFFFLFHLLSPCHLVMLLPPRTAKEKVFESPAEQDRNPDGLLVLPTRPVHLVTDP